MRKIVAVLVIVMAAKAWAYRGRPVSDLRFDGEGRLTEQSALTVEAGPNGYLAVWSEESTVRATRIDIAGNYLDGDGIVLGHASAFARIAIDGDGPCWLVVWASWDGAYARKVSWSGVADAETISLGNFTDAAVQWDGTQYVLLLSRSGTLTAWSESLYRASMSATGVRGDLTLVMKPPSTGPGYGPWIWSYPDARLVRLGTRLLAVFTESVRWGCWPVYGPFCVDAESKVLARYLDGPLFVLSPTHSPAVATNDAEAFVTGSPGIGVFISGDTPDYSFTFTQGGSRPSVAFSQTEFVVAWDSWPATIATAHVRRDSGVIGGAVMRRDDDREWTHAPVVAGNAMLPAVIGFIGEHPDYDFVPRAMLLFASEIDDESLPPRAPGNVCATRNSDNTATLTWDAVPDAFGISVDLELPGGTLRQIAVAPGGATSARIPLGKPDPIGVRARAWNSGGLSGSSYTGISVPPSATMRSTMRACPDVLATIDFTLTGTPPLTVYWSDGVMQGNLRSMVGSREVTLKHDMTLSIVRVEDQWCASNETPEKIQIKVDPAVKLTAQSPDVRIRSGETAMLTVTASNATEYAWFEGPRGDTSHPVGLDSLKYTTRPLEHSTQYWARVSNRCGAVDSEVMNVFVAAKRRAAGR